MAIDVDAAYRRYGPMVLRRCRAMLRDEQKASDAMQDVFVQLLRHHERLDDRGMSSLLYRMATNVCLNRIRSQSRRPEDPADDLLGRIAAAGSEERRSGARALLARLLGDEPEGLAWATEVLQRMVDAAMRRERHVRVHAVDGTGRSEQKMLRRPGAALLQQVKRTDQVRLNIGVGLFEAVPDSSLCREMNDDIWLGHLIGKAQCVLVFQHRLDEAMERLTFRQRTALQDRKSVV